MAVAPARRMKTEAGRKNRSSREPPWEPPHRRTARVLRVEFQPTLICVKEGGETRTLRVAEPDPAALPLRPGQMQNRDIMARLHAEETANERRYRWSWPDRTFHLCCGNL